MDSNREMYQEGLYSYDQYFKETNETYALDSDATGMWIIFSTNFVNSDNRKANGVIEVFNEPDNGRAYSKCVDDCYDKGLFSSIKADSLRIVLNGISVTKKTNNSVIAKGIIRLVGSFEGVSEIIYSFTTTEIFSDALFLNSVLRPRYEFPAKLTMNSSSYITLKFTRTLPDEFEESTETVLFAKEPRKTSRSMSSVLKMLGVS